MCSHWHRALLPAPPHLPLPLLCVLQGDLSLPLRHSVPPFSDISPTLNAACFSPPPLTPGKWTRSLSLLLELSLPSYSKASPSSPNLLTSPFSPRQVDARPVFTAEARNASLP